MDIAGVGPGSGGQFYDLVGDPMAVRTGWDSALSRATWFDRTAFRIPTPGTYATSQEKNSLRQPGFWDINMSFRKGLPVVGLAAFRPALDAFNILNRTRLGNAVTNPTLPDFGLHHVAGRQPDDADRRAVRLLIGNTGSGVRFRSERERLRPI